MTEELRNKLLLYWSDELDPAERAAVESQIANDAASRAYLDELIELNRDVAALPDPVATGVANAAIEENAKSKIVRFPTANVGWLIGIAAVIALIVGIAKLTTPFATSPPEIVQITPAQPAQTRPAKARVLLANRDDSPVEQRKRSARSRLKRLRSRLQS